MSFFSYDGLIIHRSEINPVGETLELGALAPGQSIEYYDSSSVFATLSTRLASSANRFYRRWDERVLYVVSRARFDYSREEFTAETYQALYKALIAFAACYLNKVSAQALIEEINVYWRHQMRYGANGGLVRMPQDWIVDVESIRVSLNEIRGLSLKDWLPDAPESAVPIFEDYVANMFRIADAQLSNHRVKGPKSNLIWFPVLPFY